MNRSTNRTARRAGALGIALTVVQVFVVLGAVSIFAWHALTQTRAAMNTSPHTSDEIEQVNWHEPEASKYCLACHPPVGRASGGTAAKRGHSQYVKLNDQQRAAVDAMHTVTGPNDTLICMSCHQLGSADSEPFMLAAPRRDSQLCQNCHPGRYAQGTAHDLRISAPELVNRRGETVDQAGPCSACHLAHSFAHEIQSSPSDPDGFCIPCHSEYGVAAAHTRESIEHPDAHCIHCHDPHDATHGPFLIDDIDTLCLECHENTNPEPAGASHPLGEMDYLVPEVLLAANAHIIGSESRLTCVICHDTHRADHPALLHLPASDNSLCLACHETELAARTLTGELPKHGQRPPLDDAQAAEVKHWNQPVGEQNELLCVSCHKVHGGRTNTALLSFPPNYGETCNHCHPDQKRVEGTPHDLRTNFPDLPNAAGLTPADAGACSACHLAHGFARERRPAPEDPTGVCITCHTEGGCAESMMIRGTQHPDTTCLDCHDPHNRANPAFLKMPVEELCASCHPDQSALIGGPHDISSASDAWPTAARAYTDHCLPCHVPHGGDRPDLFRVSAGPATAQHNEVCLGCHPQAGWDVQSSIAAIHPQTIAEEHSHVDVALVPSDEHGEKRLGCRTCHDPHGGATPRHLARVSADQPTESLCLTCHVEKRLITATKHSPAALAAAGYETDSCKPCHAMHADPSDTFGSVLSPRFLLQYCDVQAGCIPCQACHTDTGPGTTRTFVQHPEVITMNIYLPEDVGYLPLFDAAGKVDPQGQVTCRTCHVSHGRLDLLAKAAEHGELAADEQRLLNGQIRAFRPPNLCTECHGAAARALYLYFHEPALRANVEG